MKIKSVYEVTDFKKNEQSRWEMPGEGQDPIKELRGMFPKFTKFVLEGFIVDGKFKRLNFYR